MKRLPRLFRLVLIVLVWLTACAAPASAHDPFDGNVRIDVYPNKLEARVTLGYDAAREVLRTGGVRQGLSALAMQAGGDKLPPLPLAVAARLLAVQAGGQAVAPTALFVAAGPVETTFVAIYPRPATDTVTVRAPYYAEIDDMRAGTLVVAQGGRLVANALLSKASPQADVPLALSLATQLRVSAAAFFRLGVEHILTGIDHLLFLCALLLGMRSVRQMIGIVTAFTLAHSVTLALAALDVVALPPTVVEPVIAASIVVACILNLLRPDAARPRYGMAGVFGLVHGFGFAGALRESTLAHGGDLVVPLVAFNLGVEAGQLLVAAVVIPLLLLARRHERVAARALPLCSVLLIVLGAAWLVERLGWT